MHDALGVRRREGVSHLHGVAHRVGDRQRPSRQTRGERFTFEQLQHEKRNLLSVDLGRTDVVDRADVRMGQPGNGACLALEPFAAAVRIVDRP